MPSPRRKSPARAGSSGVNNHFCEWTIVDGPASSRAEAVVSVLLVSPLEEDHVALAHIFSRSNWELYRAQTLSSALGFLRNNQMPVVICEHDLGAESWKELFQEIQAFPDPPLLIVTSRLADDQLWADALDAGAYDVLAKPFDRDEVTRIVSLAWRWWKSERQRSSAAAPIALKPAG